MYKLRVTTNECMARFLDMYCEGRSFIWNMFFGWRKSTRLNTNIPKYYYRVPSKIWEISKQLANKYDDYKNI